MNSWNVPGQSDARGAIRNLAKTNIIFALATRFRGGARVPARLVFRHVFIATFDAPILTCDTRRFEKGRHLIYKSPKKDQECPPKKC
jgi:hypothetical protein